VQRGLPTAIEVEFSTSSVDDERLRFLAWVDSSSRSRSHPRGRRQPDHSLVAGANGSFLKAGAGEDRSCRIADGSHVVLEPKTVSSEAEEVSKRTSSVRWFGRVAAVGSFIVVAIFLFQEVALRLAPGPSTTEEWLAASLTTIERLRMAFMFSLFFFSLLTYAGVASRAGNDAARAGLVFATITCAIELAYRAVEMHAVPQWAEAYRQAQDSIVRGDLRARVEAFQDVTTALYKVIRGTALLTSACFGVALWGGSGLQRGTALLFLANAARLAMNYARPLSPALSPILDWVFIAVLAPLYTCLGAWLWSSTARSPTIHAKNESPALD
jgi:hypothetical protein